MIRPAVDLTIGLLRLPPLNKRSIEAVDLATEIIKSIHGPFIIAMPQKKKLTQAQRRAVNNRARIKNLRALIVTPRNPPPRNTSNANTFRNTRQTSTPSSNRMTVRQKGTYALAEVTAEPLQLSISPYGIQRFTSAYSALSMAFASHEQYFVHTISIEFIPELAVTEPGSIHLSPDYDPLDPMPADVNAMSSDAGYKSGAVTQRMVLSVPNLRTPDGSYTRPMLYSSPNVIERLSDYALVNYRSTGITAEGTVGRLILHYDISFHIPQVPSFPLAVAAPTLHTFTYSSPTNSSDNVRLSLFKTDADTGTLTANAGLFGYKIYTGIIDAISGLTLSSMAGRTLAIGSRVFFRAIRSTLTTDGDAEGLTNANTNVSAQIGELNLSRAFEALTEIVIKGVSADTFSLAHVLSLTG